MVITFQPLPLMISQVVAFGPRLVGVAAANSAARCLSLLNGSATSVMPE
jgi:hypothetical protein